MPLLPRLRLLLLATGAAILPLSLPMQIASASSDRHSCERVSKPEWPFAYSKHPGQREERKGRVSMNEQDMRHECQTEGVRSKCHICEEDTVCDNCERDGEGGLQSSSPSTWRYQIQGVAWEALSSNIPTVSDVPWAVGGSHRYDFESATTSHVCMYKSGVYPCQSSFGTDYSSCQLRCWGHGPGWSGRNNSIVAATTSGVDGSSVWPNRRTGSGLDVNATPWTMPLSTSTWAYPEATKGESLDNPLVRGNFTHLPQGLTFTLAGSANGEDGFVDGVGNLSRFRHPEGVAVDRDGYVYVADTGNHAIRVISPKGAVTTLAGTGDEGSADGLAIDGAQFSSPSDLAVWMDWADRNTVQTIFVADTGNHRVRKITVDVEVDEQSGEKGWTNVRVECFSGWCGSTPQAGLADGGKNVSRFDFPGGISVSGNGTVILADTNNHLIRSIDRNGRSSTVAGTIRIRERKESEEPLEDCPNPCLEGLRGSLDGYSLRARFSFPSDVSLSFGDKQVLVTDQHAVRSVDLDLGKVSTIASSADSEEGERDGLGAEASFNSPYAVSMTKDGTAYVADASSCRIRRLTPAKHVAVSVQCIDKFSSVVRPSGCWSYNPQTDENGLTVTSVAGNILYNYLLRNQSHLEFGLDFIGREIKDCISSPPQTAMAKRPWNASDTVNRFWKNAFVIDDGIYREREDPDYGTIIKLLCPPGCASTSSQPKTMGRTLEGGRYIFPEDSSVCNAAVLSGIHESRKGGFVDAVIQGLRDIDLSFWNRINATSRGFSVNEGSQEVVVQTIGGAPSSLLGESCGRRDAMPPQRAKFGTPVGIASFINSSLDSTNRFLFVADRNNNAIRAMTAVCSFPCENGGTCEKNDKCQCRDGWAGTDCTRPICDLPCRGLRSLCIAPNTCGCIAGYRGEDCSEALCVQACKHKGVCSHPDTCTCQKGWFDPRCSTPVCNQTCGNGGNCTGPDMCTCPTDWGGEDCREPVCRQDCKNGGTCIAPNTCSCSPQWSGFDCSLPVCHQGFFVPASKSIGLKRDEESYGNRPWHWLEYRPCNFAQWCNATFGFDCSQQSKTWKQLVPLHGPAWRKLTGRQRPPTFPCMQIEIRKDAVSPFQYKLAWDNGTTVHFRYSDPSPFGPTSKKVHPWNAVLKPRRDRTGPWTYQEDRQIALVEYHNVTQGYYACANSGQCIAPDTCSCAEGWMGFDCRTPVCTQGYFEPKQKLFVSGGAKAESELQAFQRFMDPNVTGRFDPFLSDSNPNFFLSVERFLNFSFFERYRDMKIGRRYMRQKYGKRANHSSYHQGGYSCSIRAVSEWESYRSGYIHDHPNFFSRYMDTKVERDGEKYTFWDGMGWSPTHHKSNNLEFIASKIFPAAARTAPRLYSYTDRGYMRKGVWRLTGAPWEKGSCIIEFNRVCTEAPNKAREIWALDSNTLVQDTDRAFRPQNKYDNRRAYPFGNWRAEGGPCIDYVKRGCYNNGTCIAPDVCRCAQGWSGEDCSIPSCTQQCLNGNCTLPNTCTCEIGWTGENCSRPICAQECNNGGTCIKPDECSCLRWENKWRNGRTDGGVPLFQKSDGSPQLTGWTGYDCSTPVCVQAERFRMNADISIHPSIDLVKLGGRGKDGKLKCDDARCPVYNEMVTMNDGRSFQTGCGYDPIDTGCCVEVDFTPRFPYSYQCFRCKEGFLEVSAHNVTCRDMNIDSFNYTLESDVPLSFRTSGGDTQVCGKDHNPGGSSYYSSMDIYTGKEMNNQNWRSNATSNRFLCNRRQWVQGSYQGLSRHVRENHRNVIHDPRDQYLWTEGGALPGEGLYECYNGGSCIGPDVCTCRDGYTGFDCRTPICRHEKPDGRVIVGCKNGGECRAKDNCQCTKTESSLWKLYNDVDISVTGWTGVDCSIPICVQGYYDPFCDEGEGCYRCQNGGRCVAPDTCECSDGWSGFDCKTPICRARATSLIFKQLRTVDPAKVQIFEKDPCGIKQGRGLCLAPGQCACNCEAEFDFRLCKAVGGKNCKKPWKDPLFRFRNVLSSNEVFGTRQCSSGWEGATDNVTDTFQSCHLSIYEPSWITRRNVLVIFFAALVLLAVLTFLLRERRHQSTIHAVISARGGIYFRTPNYGGSPKPMEKQRRAGTLH